MRTITIFIFSVLFVFLRTAAYSQDNYGLKFDGVYDMVTLSKNMISTPAAITIEARVKYRSGKDYMLVLSLEGVYGLYLNAADGYVTPFFDGSIANGNDAGYGGNLNNNQWHHLAAVHAQGTTQAFVDGVLVGSFRETLYDINSLDRASAIGAQFDGRSSHFDGIVDEVRVWNVARTANQIQADMDRRLTGAEPGLAGYWRLDEGEGQIVHDMSAKARVKFVARGNIPDSAQVLFSITEAKANDNQNDPITLGLRSKSVMISNNVTVWPGDTNNDGVVNQADVLPIGFYWGSKGPARPNASINWLGQLSAPWVPLAATRANANGDTIVNQSEISAIGLNWGKVHSSLSSPANAALEKSQTPASATINAGNHSCRAAAQSEIFDKN